MHFTPGDLAPWFSARTNFNPRYSFDLAAGQYIVLCFFGSMNRPPAQRIIGDFLAEAARYDGDRVRFFGVSIDPDDEKLERLPAPEAFFTWVWDFDQAVSRLYGAADAQSGAYRPFTLVLGPSLRVLGMLPLSEAPENHVPLVHRFLDSLPALTAQALPAPVLFAPHVFEPDFCRALIGMYERQGGTDSGFMRDVQGKTVHVLDYRLKRRADFEISDPEVIKAIHARLARRLIPEVKRAFQFEATHIERHLVACYDAATGCHFRGHRDDTTIATAHRKFAISINLNAEEYEGGDLRFAEYGPQTYRVPTGGAVVFSCSLLHEVTRLTRGRRFAFLPFLYNEAALRRGG